MSNGRSWVLKVLCFALCLSISCGDDDDGDARADAQPAQCDYFGTLYDDGECFPAADGCNSCKCNPTGQTPGEWGCSLIACGDAGPADASP